MTEVKEPGTNSKVASVQCLRLCYL